MSVQFLPRPTSCSLISRRGAWCAAPGISCTVSMSLVPYHSTYNGEGGGGSITLHVYMRGYRPCTVILSYSTRYMVCRSLDFANEQCYKEVLEGYLRICGQCSTKGIFVVNNSCCKFTCCFLQFISPPTSPAGRKSEVPGRKRVFTARN